MNVIRILYKIRRTNLYQSLNRAHIVDVYFIK